MDRPRGLIIFCELVGEKRPSDRIGNPSARCVIIQRALQRAHEHIAFGAIVEDHTKTRVRAALSVRKYFAHLGDAGILAANNEPCTRPNFGLQLERTSLANAVNAMRTRNHIALPLLLARLRADRRQMVRQKMRPAMLMRGASICASYN